MTPREFVAKVRNVAKAQQQRVLAVDFEPTKDGHLRLSVRFYPKASP